MTTEFVVSQEVRLLKLPPFVKTADTMPVLRPSNVLTVGEVGMVMDRRPGGFWAVRFSGGVYLLEAQYLENATSG